MKARFAAFLGISALCVVGAAIVAEFERAARLRIEAARLESTCSECERLNKENGQWQRAIAGAGDLDFLRSRNANILRMRASIDALELKQRFLKRALGIRDEAVWPAGAEVVREGDWKFRGQATPADAMESVLWSARMGDVDHLAGLISFEPRAKQRADDIFAGLPEAARSQYGSPEAVFATLIAAQIPTDYSAMAEIGQSYPSADSAILDVRIESENGNQRDLSLKFQQAQDAWRLDVPEAVVSQYAHQMLGPTAAR
jgi:hypothetical protein